jgi:hypothetical protein
LAGQATEILRKIRHKTLPKQPSARNVFLFFVDYTQKTGAWGMKSVKQQAGVLS